MSHELCRYLCHENLQDISKIVLGFSARLKIIEYTYYIGSIIQCVVIIIYAHVAYILHVIHIYIQLIKISTNFFSTEFVS